jgi:hypothetical protein
MNRKSIFCKIIKTASLAVAAMVVLIMSSSQKSSALINNNDPFGVIPYPITESLLGWGPDPCSDRNIARYDWVTQAGNFSNGSPVNITIDSNTNSIDLLAHSVTGVCNVNLDGNGDAINRDYSNVWVYRDWLYSTNGTTLSMNGPPELQLPADYNNRYWYGNVGLTLGGLNALPVGRTTSVQVGLRFRTINQRTSGSNPYICTDPLDPNDTGGMNLRYYDRCYGYSPGFIVNVTKLPPAANSVGYMDVADCSTVSGWAADLNDLSAPLALNVYVNGQGPVGGVTNIFRGDVNAAIGGNGSHGFTVDFSSLIGPGRLDGGNYNVSVAAINSAGAIYWLKTGADLTTLTVPNCPPPDRPPDGGVDPFDPNPNAPEVNGRSTCSTLRGAARDADLSGNISVDIYRDGNFETRVSTSGERWSYGISQYKDFVGHTFEAFALGVDRNGTPNGVNISIGKIFVGPCATISCQAITTSGLVEAGSTFKLRTGINAQMGSSGSPINVTARLTISGATILPGTITQSISPGSDAPSFEWNVLINNSGFYGGSVSFTINGNVTNCDFGGYNPSCPIANPNCSPPICPQSNSYCCPPGTCNPSCIASDRCPIEISVRPYFKVYGGNVVAGVNETTCEIGSVDTLNSPGRILAFSRGGGNGSGTQLIAQALSTIEGFSSAQGPAGNSNPDKGLSLSNITVAPNGNATYGGGFGTANCPDIPTQGQTATTFDNSAGLTTVPVATKQVIYVTGDVTISNNITYGGGPWNGIEQIPSFTLVVTGGNIYIDNDVTELHGLFVAKPSGSMGGNIYTCTEGVRQYTPSELSSGSNDQNNLPCSKPLTVYGSFMAKQVKLLRTNGKTINANNSDTWVTPLPAEKFIYTPELWIRPNGAGTTTEKGKLDSLKPLPPIL